MMMYFEFNEDRLIQNHFTQEQCFSVIDKVMNEYGVYANQPGTYIASDESGFNAFSILKCNLPKTKWFLKVIEKWFWFDDEMILIGMTSVLIAFILFKSMGRNL